MQKIVCLFGLFPDSGQVTSVKVQRYAEKGCETCVKLSVTTVTEMAHRV